jgi:hypothetical protein
LPRPHCDVPHRYPKKEKGFVDIQEVVGSFSSLGSTILTCRAS